jgi:hypothetical protein
MGSKEKRSHFRGNSFGEAQIIDVINIEHAMPSKQRDVNDVGFQREEVE